MSYTTDAVIDEMNKIRDQEIMKYPCERCIGLSEEDRCCNCIRNTNNSNDVMGSCADLYEQGKNIDKETEEDDKKEIESWIEIDGDIFEREANRKYASSEHKVQGATK